MIADEHALLEERRVGASVAELATQTIAHVIDLQERVATQYPNRLWPDSERHLPGSPSLRPRSSQQVVLRKRRRSLASVWTRWHFGTAKSG